MGISATFAQNVPALVNLVKNQYTFRNRIINGNCNIAQRPSMAYPSGTSSYGGPDRFTAANQIGTGGQFTQSQGSITYNGLTYDAVVQTVNTANTNITGTYYWTGFMQNIEGANCYDLVGQPIVVSFIFNTNVTGTYSFALRNSPATNSYVTTFNALANVPQRVVLTIPPIPLSTTIPLSNTLGLQPSIGFLNTGTYQTSTLGWQAGNYIAAAGSTNWGLTAGNFIALTEMQLEPGVEATPFEVRQFNTELTLCQRYYQIIRATVRTYAGGAGVPYDVTVASQMMRTTPTSALLGFESNFNLSSATLLSTGNNGFRFEIVSTAVGDTYAVGYEYGLSAEL